MKIFFSIIGIMVIITCIGLWFVLSSNEEVSIPEIPTTFPIDSIERDNRDVSNQNEMKGIQPDIAESFLRQINNADQINLGGTIVVSSFALQMWNDENMAGEALLVYDLQRGWILVLMGGGAWSQEGLVDVGVPNDIAEGLIQGRGWSRK